MTRMIVVGGGSIGQRHARNAIFGIPNAELTIVFRHSSISPDLLNAKNIHCSSLIDVNCQYDCAIIASPAPFHLDHLRLLSPITRAVMIEKPLYSAWHDKPSDVDLASIDTTNCFVGYVLRFDPIIVETKKLIDELCYGQVQKARVWAGQDLRQWRPTVNYKTTVSASKALGGGVLHELSHELDYITFLLGFPSRVFAASGNYSNLELDVEDSIDIFLDYSDKFASISLDFIANSPRLGFELLLENAVISADFTDRTLIITQFGKPPVAVDVSIDSFNDLYMSQQDHLLSLAIGRSTKDESSKCFVPCSLPHAQQVMSVIDSIQASCACGSWVSL